MNPSSIKAVNKCTFAPRLLAVFLLCISFSQAACSMDDKLPRNQIPEIFHPHRTEFTCKHELTVAPPLDPQAERWYQEALALDTPDVWKDDRNWPRIIELYTKAAERKHWKAMNNLATLYQTGVWGLKDSNKVFVARNSKAAMALTEDAMRMGVPLAYAVMGNYYSDGFVVKQDATAAWAFWQQAADMGSDYAQFTIGRSLLTSQDAPERSRWANTPIGVKMLECAFAQGNGNAAEELGVQYKIVNNDKPRALHYLHEGVKFGNAQAANYLADEFENVGGLAPHGIDQARADRYWALGKALAHNPDLRLPNLDKILPLPPAKLPQWNGKPADLINAAKPVIYAPSSSIKTSDANLSGRIDIELEQLASQDFPAEVRSGHWRIAAITPVPLSCNGSDICPHSGIWQPSLPAEHLLGQLVNLSWREAAVMEGQRFPDPQKSWLVEAQSHEVTWHLIETI